MGISMFWIFIIVLFIVSFIWTLFSLRREIGHPKQILKAKKELARSKVLFKK